MDQNFNEAVAKIASHIEVEDESRKNLIAACILMTHLNRTKLHVSLVRRFALRIAKAFPSRPWTMDLLESVRHHDEDKLKDFSFIGDYAPYIVEKYGPDWLKGMFKTNESYDDEWDKVFVVQHMKNNPHHPEHWCGTYDYGENHPPYDVTRMPDWCIAEACADSMAVGFEQGNGAREFIEKNKLPKWSMSKRQLSLLNEILSKEGKFREEVASSIGENKI